VGEPVTVTVLEGLRSASGDPIYPAESRTFSIWPNRPPVPGTPETFTVPEDGFLEVHSPTLQSNDFDPAGDAVAVATNVVVTGRIYDLIQQFQRLFTNNVPLFYVGDWPSGSWALVVPAFAQHGRLDLRSDGTFTYRPDTNFTGIDAFQYRLTDGSNIS